MATTPQQCTSQETIFVTGSSTYKLDVSTRMLYKIILNEHTEIAYEKVNYEKRKLIHTIIPAVYEAPVGVKQYYDIPDEVVIFSKGFLNLETFVRLYLYLLNNGCTQSNAIQMVESISFDPNLPYSFDELYGCISNAA